MEEINEPAIYKHPNKENQLIEKGDRPPLEKKGKRNTCTTKIHLPLDKKNDPDRTHSIKVVSHENRTVTYPSHKAFHTLGLGTISKGNPSRSPSSNYSCVDKFACAAATRAIGTR